MSGKRATTSSGSHGVDLNAMTPSQLEGVDEATWLDVIRKMDEVYLQLVEDEVALEEKNAQLEQSQQFIFSLLSAMSDVLVACNARGDIEETNVALRELVGMQESALHGMSIYQLLADDDSAATLRTVIDNVSPGRSANVVELNLFDAERSIVPVDVSCTPRIGPNGKREGYVFVGRPMAEIKRAYHQLREAHEALKRTQQQLLHAEKMASLGRLVAGVAHELNNPISFVLGNVHALKRYSERLAAYVALLHSGNDGAEAERQRIRLRIDHILQDMPSLIEGTLEGAQRTADIVRGLKRFSAVDREEPSVFDLSEVVERAIHWVKKGTAPTFEVHWSPLPGCLVMGSAGHVQQVMMNLIQNAYDAAASRDDAVPALWIALDRLDDRVVLRFRDNGPGIAAEHLARVFDPFFSTKPVGKGTGLGLSISYGIVERHGGRLLVRNHPEGGAEFTVELPAGHGKESSAGGR